MANLSLKGICSLSHQLIDKDGKVNIHNIEMNQDDFEDCVMLTVEEAKSLLNMTKVFCICAQASNHKHLGHLIDLEKALTNRIEQVEKGNEVN